MHFQRYHFYITYKYICILDQSYIHIINHILFCRDDCYAARCIEAIDFIIMVFIPRSPVLLVRQQYIDIVQAHVALAATTAIDSCRRIYISFEADGSAAI